jgi:Ala-tRNA(Pro) deacylase
MEAAGGTDGTGAGPRLRRAAHPPLTSYLEAHDIAFRVVEPSRRFTSEAGAAGGEAAPAANACRAILLRTEDGWRLAVIPSRRRLDLAKTRTALSEPRLRLASESEGAALFPEFELGLVPPIGPHYPHPDVLDGRLLEHDEVLCEAGDSGRRLAIDPRAIVSLAGPAVADVCVD